MLSGKKYVEIDSGKTVKEGMKSNNILIKSKKIKGGVI